MHKKICPVFFLLLITNLRLLEAQVDNYSFRKEHLQEQMAWLKIKTDSIYNIHTDLYNGRIYTSDADRINHPFFLENSWVHGIVYYSGIFSDNELIKYDLITDNLIIMMQAGGVSYPLSINREVIKGYIISGHHFVYLDHFQDANAPELKPGYYEVLYNGSTGLFARWTKSKAIDKATMQTLYPLEVRYFVRKEGDYYLIKNNAGFLNALNDHQDEIKSYMKTNRLRFSHEKGEDLIKVLEFYDSLLIR